MSTLSVISKYRKAITKPVCNNLKLEVILIYISKFETEPSQLKKHETIPATYLPHNLCFNANDFQLNKWLQQRK